MEDEGGAGVQQLRNLSESLIDGEATLGEEVVPTMAGSAPIPDTQLQEIDLEILEALRASLYLGAL
jgi:hypothetical protein